MGATMVKSGTNGTAAKPAERWLSNEVEFTPFMSKDPLKLSVLGVQRFICNKTKSGATCSEEQALKFIMLCKARLLNPYEGDAYLIGFDSKDGPAFSLVTAHQAFLKRAETHPEYDGMESGTIVQKGADIIDLEGDFVPDGYKLLGGWATVYVKNKSRPMKKRLKLATFNQNRSRWNIDPAGMIVKCAEADALRSAFPNSLGGMYLEDELPTTTPQVVAEKPKTLTALVAQAAIETTATESDNQPTDPPPQDEQIGESVDPDELAVLDRIGELSRKLGMSEQQAASEQAAYFKTRGIKDATVSALRAYADSLEGRMEQE